MFPNHKWRAGKMQKDRESRGDRHANKWEKVDKFLCHFETTYNLYYGRRIEVHYKRGWYYWDRNKYHKSFLEKLLNRMLVELYLSENPQQESEEDDDV